MPHYRNKDPNTTESFGWDWGFKLGIGQSIVSALVTTAEGEVVVEDSEVVDGRYVNALVSGGSFGVRNSILCHVTRSDALTFEDTIVLRIVNK
jgi:hypothetical protein